MKKQTDLDTYLCQTLNTQELLKSFSDNISEFNSQLKNFIYESEDHFLLIGEKLQDFNSRSKQILQDAFDITHLLSSDSLNDGIQELKSVLNAEEAYLLDTYTKFNESENIFFEIGSFLMIISDNIAEFRKLVKHLQSHSIAVKIESSRFLNTDFGFSTLAENIEELAGNIARQSYGMTKRSRELETIVCNTKTFISEIKNVQHVNAENLITKSQLYLNSLIEKYDYFSREAASIHGIAENVVKQVNSMVYAVQFQDITRQQIEHVLFAINDLNVNIKSSNTEDVNFNINHINNGVKIFELQAAQLNNTKTELSQATLVITSGLTEINRNISLIAELISNILLDNDNRSNNFIEKISSGLHQTLCTLEKNADINSGFADKVTDVANTINSFSQFINEISVIGADIELIALNASVKAARTGVEGAALGVLADAVQKLSVNAKNRTSFVIERLSSVKGHSDILLAQNNEKTEIHEKERLAAVSVRINHIIEILNNLQGKVKTSISNLQLSVQNLKQEIEELIDWNNTLNIGHSLTSIIDSMEQLCSDAGNINSHGELTGIYVTELDKKYTMQIQRDIHNTIINNDKPKQPDTQLVKSKSQVEFGNNVELF